MDFKWILIHYKGFYILNGVKSIIVDFIGLFFYENNRL